MAAQPEVQHKRGPDRRLKPGRPFGGTDRRHNIDRRQFGNLLASPLFAGLAYYHVESVVAACPLRSLEAGEILLEPGRPNNLMFVVLSGRLDVRLGDGDAADAIPIGPGGTLGELSIIDEQPVSARVSAAEPSRVLTIPGRVFWDDLLQVPGFARNLARVLTTRMRASNERIVQRLREHLALEHLQKELQIARSIQTGMLPGRGAMFHGRSDIEVYGMMDPARDIGGDLYDAFFVAPDRLAIAIGDVSGKGIPAALFMARVVAQLRLVAMAEESPAEVLSRLNAMLCEHNDAGMFVTMLYVVLDLRTGAYRYSNAGHNPPAIVAAGRCAYLPLPKGLVAGMMPGARFSELGGSLSPGELLLLYTDGVTEALNDAQDLYGEERLAASACSTGGEDPGAVIERVRQSVDAFAAGAPQADDITMLAVRRLD